MCEIALRTSVLDIPIDCFLTTPIPLPSRHPTPGIFYYYCDRFTLLEIVY